MKECPFPERGHPAYVDGPEGKSYAARHGACPACMLESQKRYKHSEKGKANNRRRMRRWRQTERGQDVTRADNERRVRVGGMYLGLSGFTLREREELLHHGTSD